MRSICVYCGSSPGLDPSFCDAAAELGQCLASREIKLVYGGGHVGLMGVLADAVLTGGGEVHGIITRALLEKEVAHEGLTTLQVVETMHERKAAMADASDGFIMLPGGLGTLEEFLEVATWAQLGIQAKPCGVVNVSNYFDPLIELLESATEQRFLRREHRDLVLFASDPIALLDRFSSWVPSSVDKWMDMKDI
jgi:uncharacterized protein (TIGR00730 family)